MHVSDRSILSVHTTNEWEKVAETLRNCYISPPVVKHTFIYIDALILEKLEIYSRLIFLSILL